MIYIYMFSICSSDAFIQGDVSNSTSYQQQLLGEDVLGFQAPKTL